MERYQKVAVFGGVYNNYLALEQLLKECMRIGVDAIFCLGDMGGFGPHPDRSFPFLRHGKILSIAGNYDISLAEGKEDCGCGYTDPRDNHFAQISYEYTLKKTSDENKAWLGTLPHSWRFLLGPLKVLLCHGSPRKTNEFLWESTSPDHLLGKFTQDFAADVICCTHTGIKWHRNLPKGRHFLNVGVIGRPENDGQTNVWFSVLESCNGELSCRFHPLEYGHEWLAKEMKEEGLPVEFIATIRTGWWTTCLEIMPGKERLRGKF
ncbi:MAG: metallophosphoesterase family protein [Acidobacteriota bacterium]